MAMRYDIIPPPAHLEKFVRFFWTLEYENSDGKPYIYRSMADGCTEMVFHYAGPFTELTDRGREFQGNALLHSQSARYRRFETEGNFGIFGVYLYPFTVRQLLKIPASELTDGMYPLEQLLGQDGREVEEKIITAAGNMQRVQVIARFLERRLFGDMAHESPVERAIRFMLHTPEIPTVQELSSQVYLSTRQFERKFKEYSGFSPKLYTRILRFHQAMKNFGRMQEKNLTDIAYDCGYYDQSHFIHEFKQFSGYHPGTFFYGETEGMEVRNS